MSENNLLSLTNASNLPPAVAHQKVQKASQEFEGLLLGALWKSMGEGFKDSFGSGEEDSGGSSFIDMGIEAMSSGVAASGGIGIGRMLMKAIEQHSNTQKAIPPAGEEPK